MRFSMLLGDAKRGANAANAEQIRAKKTTRAIVAGRIGMPAILPENGVAATRYRDPTPGDTTSVAPV
jgi:hypothetical protein